jgi:hypothetical protein
MFIEEEGSITSTSIKKVHDKLSSNFFKLGEEKVKFEKKNDLIFCILMGNRQFDKL